jgi:hypothetical protein
VVVFAASAFLVQTFEELIRESSARYAVHDVIGGKPIVEFTGAELRTMDFKITLHSSFGVEPLSFYEKLQDMTEKGLPQRVFIEGKNQGQYNILKVRGETTMWAKGRPAVMSIDLSLREYIRSLPTQAEQKLREDELRRSDTGKGGPERLPGAGEPIQPRTLKIDNSMRVK